MRNALNMPKRTLALSGLLLCIGGLAWLLVHWQQPDRFCAECIPVAQADIQIVQSQSPLTDGSVVTMDSSMFRYLPEGTWTVSEMGADPGEPDLPDSQPAGIVEFDYVGEELDLLIATGNFWGFMLVTVDEKPANLLPWMVGKNIIRPHSACAEEAVGCEQLRIQLAERGKIGYKTFYEPETQTDAEWRAGLPTTRWLRVHSDPNPLSEPRRVRIEIWRSWGQMPLRGVAVDALPAEPQPFWPGVLAVVIGLGILWIGADSHSSRSPFLPTTSGNPAHRLSHLLLPLRPLLAWTHQVADRLYWPVAGFGIAAIIGGIGLQLWWLSFAGLALLSVTTLVSMNSWVATLLFGLPFYFGITLPVLPGRAVSLLDVGVWCGCALLLVNWLSRQSLLGLSDAKADRVTLGTEALHALRGESETSYGRFINLSLGMLIGWALVVTFSADYFSVALREWRTVFLTAGLFAMLITYTLRTAQRAVQTRDLLIGAWLLGGTAVAMIGLWQYVTGNMLITAEGVSRIRAFYGSPNNLALYLDRTLAVTLALGLFSNSTRLRWLWRGAAAIQLAALVLTFSKGGLFLGLPAMLAVIASAAWMQTRERHTPSMVERLGWSSRSVLIWVVGFAVASLLALLPFLGTERFQRLLDFSQGTSFLRLQLWQSAWRMVLEHPWLGVGPDNFLYSYRTDYILPPAWQERDLNHPHNWFLDWWTRLGLPGLVLGLAFWVAGLRRAWLRSRREIALNVGILAAGASALAHGLIDVSYALPDLMLVWVFLLLL